eukprot:TRINITY_DN64162_c0_g1_i1.p1 TRINITY_DN64162_c0_g1~~TRINITY_DN64162_c0_g1_i1.p1  ORF type:complete len:121 (+),score=25.42 TRINITY_DN64162_c0_g1_i1:134-496(+)
MSNGTAEEVNLKLIFANLDENQECSVALNTPVRDVKEAILEKYWPQSLPEVDSVERLRLFAGGKELGGKDGEDQKSLKDMKITVSPNFATPVHVQLVLKSSEPAVENEASKSKPCFCILL